MDPAENASKKLNNAFIPNKFSHQNKCDKYQLQFRESEVSDCSVFADFPFEYRSIAAINHDPLCRELYDIVRLILFVSEPRIISQCVRNHNVVREVYMIDHSSEMPLRFLLWNEFLEQNGRSFAVAAECQNILQVTFVAGMIYDGFAVTHTPDSSVKQITDEMKSRIKKRKEWLANKRMALLTMEAAAKKIPFHQDVREAGAIDFEACTPPDSILARSKTIGLRSSLEDYRSDAWLEKSTSKLDAYLVQKRLADSLPNKRVQKSLKFETEEELQNKGGPTDCARSELTHNKVSAHQLLNESGSSHIVELTEKAKPYCRPFPPISGQPRGSYHFDIVAAVLYVSKIQIVHYLESKAQHICEIYLIDTSCGKPFTFIIRNQFIDENRQLLIDWGNMQCVLNFTVLTAISFTGFALTHSKETTIKQVQSGGVADALSSWINANRYWLADAHQNIPLPQNETKTADTSHGLVLQIIDGDDLRLCHRLQRKYQPIAAIPHDITNDQLYDVMGVLIYVTDQRLLSEATDGVTPVQDLYISDWSYAQPLRIILMSDIVQEHLWCIRSLDTASLVIGVTALVGRFYHGFVMHQIAETQLVVGLPTDITTVFNEWAGECYRALEEQVDELKRIHECNEQTCPMPLSYIKTLTSLSTYQQACYNIEGFIPDETMDRLHIYARCEVCCCRVSSAAHAIVICAYCTSDNTVCQGLF